jgi:ribosome-associated protein
LNKKNIIQSIIDNIEFSFSHSSGPGGQNVNKLNTKVLAKLSLYKITGISKEELSKIKDSLRNRINNQDELLLQVQEQRKQLQNKEIALNRMIELILNALKKRKKRIATGPSKSSKEERLRSKKEHSQKKKLRKIEDNNLGNL